jgi:hypothetical protein
LRWHPSGSQSVSSPSSVAERKTSKAKASSEMLEFLSRTAVQSEKELLSNLEEVVSQPQLQSNDQASLTEFRRIIAKVQKNERGAFRQIRTTATTATTAATASTMGAATVIQSPVVGALANALAQTPENGLSEPDSKVDAFANAIPADIDSRAFVNYADSDSDEDMEYGPGLESGIALRGLLKELNDWLSAGVSPARPGPSRKTGDEFSSAQQRITDGHLAGSQSQASLELHPKNHSSEHSTSVANNHSQLDIVTMRALTNEAMPSLSRFGFEQSRDWNYAASMRAAPEGQTDRVRSKLSPLLEAARRMIVGVKNLPLGRRIESHENGAMLEKDELGRVTQIRAQSGEIISVYYGRDGAPEGFVRTDARGVLHSVAECDAQGVVLRDENGRVRAAGDSLFIDPLGRISICRSDGQYWSIDLARQMLSEKRRLADPTGRWTALTAVFAADGFRMMTLFQKLTPTPGKSPLRSHVDANRIWSSAAVEDGHFRFYGRDGSTIEFTSEESLASLIPAYVSSPGVRPIEPRWQARHQAGTAWQSVHDYVTSYLAI